MLLIIIMNLLFASTFRIGKAGLQYTDAYILTGSRMIIAGALFLCLHYLHNRKKGSLISSVDGWLFAKAALFYVILSFVPEFWALTYISPLKANILWSGLPFASALLSYFLLKERLTPYKIIGLCIGFAALIPVLCIPDQSASTIHHTVHKFLPEIMMFIAVISTAYAWLLIKQLLDKGYSLITINGITMTVGGIATIALRYVMMGTAQPLVTNYWYAAQAIIALTIVSNIIGYMIYGHLLKTYSLTLLSFSGFLCPIFGAFIERCVFNQAIDYRYIIAFIGIFIGLYIFYRSELTHKKIS